MTAHFTDVPHPADAPRAQRLSVDDFVTLWRRVRIAGVRYRTPLRLFFVEYGGESWCYAAHSAADAARAHWDLSGRYDEDEDGDPWDVNRVEPGAVQFIGGDTDESDVVRVPGARWIDATPKRGGLMVATAADLAASANPGDLISTTCF